LGCNKPVDMKTCQGSCSGANLLYDHYHIMAVLGDLGVDKDWELGASCVADCVPLIVHVDACSFIFDFYVL